MVCPAQNKDTLFIVKDTMPIRFKNGLTINLESILVLDLKFSYSHRLSRRLYFESMLSYSLPYGTSLAIPYFNNYTSITDPCWLYGRAQIRTGIKYYPGRRFYLGGNLLYSYGEFNKKKDIEFRNYNEYFKVTRFKDDLEIFAKCGWTWQDKHKIIDFYTGIGYRYKFLHDIFYGSSLKESHKYIFYDFPVTKNSQYGVLSIHFGLQIGYCW
jgi:hypothetical protein